jgi:copper homeostasis protein
MVKKNIPIKEACVESTDQAVNAERNGANRIELCKNLDLDGLTPEVNVIQSTMKSVNIPVKVMIRPRPGNFIYSHDEIKSMEQDIDLCKKLNVPEVVIGILTSRGNIDTIIAKRLASRAYPMAITFHKAIDQTEDILYELDRLSRIQEISSILTSGGEKTAIKGQSMLRKIIDQYGKRFTIIAAGSVTHENFDEIHGLINAREYHGKNLIA